MLPIFINPVVYTFPSVPINPPITGVGIACEPPKEEKKDYSGGCVCRKCKEIFPYAEPNQKDGTLVCYACRHGL